MSFWLPQVSTSSQPGPTPSVSVCVTTQSGQLQLAGSVAAGVPVLTSIQGSCFSVPACLRGPVLVFQAAPTPGLLPAVIGQWVSKEWSRVCLHCGGWGVGGGDCIPCEQKPHAYMCMHSHTHRFDTLCLVHYEGQTGERQPEREQMFINASFQLPLAPGSF